MINRLTLKQILPYCLGLLILNLILSVVFWKLDATGSENLDGSYNAPGSTSVLSAMLMTFIISLPIFSLLLGTITAIFINREVPYGKRYVKAFLLTLVFFYSLATIGGVMRIMFGTF